MNAAQVLATARSRHPAFDRQAHPDSALIRVLDAYHRQLYLEAVAANNRYNVTVETILLPLAVFANGYALSAHIDVLGATLVDDDGRTTINMKTFEHRNVPRRFPSAYVLNGRFYPIGLTADWATGDIDVQLTIAPTEVIQVDQELQLDDRALPALAAHVACLLALRARVPSKEVGELTGEKVSSRAAFLASVTQDGV